VEDFDLDGIDLDYEPSGISCTVTNGAVSCNTDQQSVSVATLLRQALPQPTYLMGAATWHIGAYGEGAFQNSKVRACSAMPHVHAGLHAHAGFHPMPNANSLFDRVSMTV
jgi:hypothetical protein